VWLAGQRGASADTPRCARCARVKSLIATLCNSRHRIARSRGITPDEFEPHALLAVEDAGGERLAEVRVGAGFKRNAASEEAWAENGYRRPG